MKVTQLMLYILYCYYVNDISCLFIKVFNREEVTNKRAPGKRSSSDKQVSMIATQILKPTVSITLPPLSFRSAKVLALGGLTRYGKLTSLFKRCT